MSNHMKYFIEFSEEDNEWVGTCSEFPSLSWLDPYPKEALRGIMDLVSDTIKDLTDKEKEE